MDKTVEAVGVLLLAVFIIVLCFVGLPWVLRQANDHVAASNKEEAAREAASPPDPYSVKLGISSSSKVRVWVDPETGCQYLATYSAGLVIIPRTGRDGLVVCTQTQTQEPAR